MSTAGASAPELFHVGYLVADIEAARAKFEQLLGVQFHPPVTLDLTVETARQARPHPYRSTLSYSTAGPVYTELVEADTSDYKSLSQGERIHHVGYWVDDVEGHRARQQQLEIGDEVVIRYPESENIRQWFCHPLDFHGARVEFFDRAWRPDFEHWLQNWPTDGQKGVTS